MNAPVASAAPMPAPAADWRASRTAATISAPPASAQRGRALAEEEDRRGHAEDRAAAARQRVDDAQVAVLVAALQRAEVADVQQGRCRP